MDKLYKVIDNGDGMVVLEAFGFQSMPFPKEELELNKLYFNFTLNEEAEGTVQ